MQGRAPSRRQFCGHEQLSRSKIIHQLQHHHQSSAKHPLQLKLLSDAASARAVTLPCNTLSPTCLAHRQQTLVRSSTGKCPPVHYYKVNPRVKPPASSPTIFVRPHSLHSRKRASSGPCSARICHSDNFAPWSRGARDADTGFAFVGSLEFSFSSGCYSMLTASLSPDTY